MYRRILVLLCCLLAVSAARAQLPSAEITGSVTDATAGLVSGATVTITNTATNIQRTLTTNASGVYEAPALPPGSYSIKVTMTGFKTEVRGNVQMQVDQVARIDFSLQVGNVPSSFISHGKKNVYTLNINGNRLVA